MALPFDDGSFDVATASYLLPVLDRDARRRSPSAHEFSRPGADTGRPRLLHLAAPSRLPSPNFLVPLTVANLSLLGARGSQPRMSTSSKKAARANQD